MVLYSSCKQKSPAGLTGYGVRSLVDAALGQLLEKRFLYVAFTADGMRKCVALQPYLLLVMVSGSTPLTVLLLA